MEKNKHAQAMAHRRSEKLTPERRSEIARMGAKAKHLKAKKLSPRKKS